MHNDRVLTRFVRAEIHPSGSELATCFWAMGPEDQAMFFNTLNHISEGRLIFQLQAVTDCEELTYEGRYAMECIGEYSAKYPEGFEI